MYCKFEVAVSKLREACGFENSESGTEELLDLLAEAVKRTKKARAQSHRQGLCLDCQADLGGQLEELLNHAGMDESAN